MTSLAATFKKTSRRSRDTDECFGHLLSVSWSLGYSHKKQDVSSSTFTNAAWPRLTRKDLERALGMLMVGTSGAEVDRHFGVHRSTI